MIEPSPHASRTGTDGWSNAMPPPTSMKSLWHDSLVTCAALNSAASRLSITMWRPLMPPEALHHEANALANCTNSFSRPGTTVLDASLGTAMWIVLVPTPRTEDAPPAPDSQILPTPGHSPFVAGEELARVRVGDTDAPAGETRGQCRRTRNQRRDRHERQRPASESSGSHL